MINNYPKSFLQKLQLISLISLLTLTFNVNFALSERPRLDNNKSSKTSNSAPKTQKRGTYVKFDLESRVTNADSNTAYVLKKILLLDKNGRTTSQPEVANDVMLHFECNQLMYSSTCGAELADLMIAVQGGKFKRSTKNLLRRYANNVEINLPIPISGISPQDSKSDFDKLRSNAKYNGGFSLTVPITEVLNYNDPLAAFTVNLRDENNKTESSTTSTPQSSLKGDAGCNTTDDCPKGTYCTTNKVCSECNGNKESRQCPNGQVCTTSDKCRDGNCSWDQKCPPKHVCKNNVCISVECSNSSECPRGQVCTEDKCVDGNCSNSGDCGCKEVCMDGQCQSLGDDGCNWHIDFKCPNVCPKDAVCNRENKCEEAECTDDTHCEGLTYCKDGTCVPGCIPTLDRCGVGYVCNTDTRECEPGCKGDGDCKHCTKCDEKNTRKCIPINNGNCPKGCDSQDAIIENCGPNGEPGVCCDYMCRVGKKSCNSREPIPSPIYTVAPSPQPSIIPPSPQPSIIPPSPSPSPFPDDGNSDCEYDGQKICYNDNGTYTTVADCDSCQGRCLVCTSAQI